MEYQDFTIELRSAGSGRFEATAVETPIRRSPRIFFPAPIEEEKLRDLLTAFDRPGTELAQGPPPKVSPSQLGETLYSALFQDPMADLFRECQATLPRDRRSGLRLRLRFPLDDEEAKYLAALPWEWLCDPKTGKFLATKLCTPVIRDPAAGQRRGTLEVGLPLRILVVDAAPGTMKQLNLKLEIERMSEALKPLEDDGHVELSKLAEPTPEALRDALLNAEKEFHVLHFMGHGGYDPGSGFGAVFFVGQDGSSKDQVSGEMLATYLMDIPSLRLVVLNSCKTARHGRGLGAPFNEGVASAVLARTGVQAVVANQYSISDPTAISFSAAFYGQIAEGWGVDAALTEARLRLEQRTSEWATPVLFLTSRDGKLFDMEKLQRKNTVRIPRSQNPVCLGVRSIVGWGSDMKKRNDAVLDLTQYFEDRYIQEKPWWQEKVFPALRAFLRENIEERRPLLLDFAAHSSIAFAAGWLLEPKSGLDVRVRQRTGSEGEFEWSPKDGRDAEGPLWLDRPDIGFDSEATDVALALSVSQPDVAEHVREFVRNQSGQIGRISRIIDAVIAPEPGPRSVQGGAHALRLAHSLLPRLRRKLPHERGGRVHFFCACPNALSFYLGQLASSLEGAVLYEHPFRAPGSYGQYQKSIELPPPGEAKGIPKDW